MAALVCPRERFLGLVQSVLRGEKHPELECSVRDAPFVGASIRRLRGAHVLAMLEQNAEVVGGRPVAALVGALERLFGFGQLVLAGEQDRQLERSHGVAAFVGAPVRRRSAGDVASLLEQHA